MAGELDERALGNHENPGSKPSQGSEHEDLGSSPNKNSQEILHNYCLSNFQPSSVHGWTSIGLPPWCPQHKLNAKGRGK